MEIIQKNIKELITLGFSENEAKTFLTLMIKNNMTVAEIAQVSEVPRSKLYEIIKRLIAKGLCKEINGKIKKYSAVDPEIISDSLIKQYEKQFEEKKTKTEYFFQDITSIYNENIDKNDPLEYIHFLKDKNQIRKKYSTLEKEAKSEILLFSKPPFSMIVDENKEAFRALDRDVRIRAIYEIEESRRAEFCDKIRKSETAGEKIKVSDDLPLKLVIFDNKTVMFALRDRITLKPNLSTIIIEHPDFAKAFKRVFES
jgi:sugar-specific transcriptional regulator TrmB